MNKRPPTSGSDQADPPRRRTPTYMEAVKPAAPVVVAATKPEAAGEAEPPAESLDSLKRGGPSRTRIGLPPVTVLPSQGRRRDQAGEGDSGSSPERSHLTALAPVDAPRVLSRETVLMGAAPKPEPGAGAERPQSLVVARSRVDSRADAGALQPASAPRGGKARPAVPAAEVSATRHSLTSERSWPLVLLNPKLLPQAASIRSLRHRLAERGEPRVVAITSGTRREGKTFCAVNLALSLAEVRRSRVLLLEANPYQPSLASVFGLTKHTCFFEQLEEHKKDFLAPWKVTELSTYDLHLLAVDPRSTKLKALEGGSFAHCLDSLRGAYDYIVVDAPAVSAGPDIPLLEDAVDGLVFVTRSDRSRARTLRYALDQVSPQDLLGVVLLDF